MKKVDKYSFAKRLKELMEENNETTYSVAEVVHLTAATISRYLKGEMAPKITTVEVLARHFNVNPAWLLGYDVPRELENINKSNSVEIENPDIRAIARAGKNMTPKQAAELKSLAERLFPDAFRDIN